MDDFNTNNNGYNNEPVNNPPANNYNTDFLQSDNSVQPDQIYNQYDMNQQPKGNGLAIASLVLGIVAIAGTCCCTCINVICGALAIIFGIVVYKQQREGEGYARAGIICGGIGVGLGIIITIVNAVKMANGTNEVQNMLESLQSAFYMIIK